MIGGRRAAFLEERAPPAMRLQIAIPARCVAAGNLGETVDVGPESFELRIDDGVRSVGRENPAVPARAGDRVMLAQRIERTVGCRQHLDVEAPVKRARSKLRRRESIGYAVKIVVGGLGRQTPLEAEQRLEDMVEPHACRRSAEEMIVGRKNPLDRAGSEAAAGGVFLPDATILECVALALEHPVAD